MIFAPFTAEQIAALNRWQRAGTVHPFTCPNLHGALVAHADGWRCPSCAYRQPWAHPFMLDEPPAPIIPIQS